jgi:hypothetical protein
MRWLRLSLLVVAIVLPVVLATGCKQGVGDGCKQPSDCEDGLVCAIPAGTSSGHCEPFGYDGGVLTSTDGASGDR